MEINPIRTAMVDTIKSKGQVDFVDNTNGQKLTLDSFTGVIDIANSAQVTISTVTATTVANYLPAGALILSVTARVLTVLTGAAGTWSLGISGATTRYGTSLALAAGTTVTMANHLVTQSPVFVATAAPLVLTSSSGTWTGGTVRLTVHYLSSTAPVN